MSGCVFYHYFHSLSIFGSNKVVMLFKIEVFDLILLIGLTRSEKTSVMTTPKRPRAHFWQICQKIYPPSIEHRCLEYCYTKLGRSSPLSIKHRCLEYHYTKLGRSTGKSAGRSSTPSIEHRCLESCQLSIDALNTTTPNLADLLADLPPS